MVVVVGQWRVGTLGVELWGIMGQYGELWGELWLNYGDLWGIMGQLWFYGVLWGIMGSYVRVFADASFLLFPFVLIPTDLSDSDFHAFNNELYVRLSYLYKPPKQYLSQGHLARVMKKQDIKYFSNTKIGLIGAEGRSGGRWVSCTAAVQLVPPGHSP